VDVDVDVVEALSEESEEPSPKLKSGTLILTGLVMMWHFRAMPISY
jgi:hypothetical protein